MSDPDGYGWPVEPEPATPAAGNAARAGLVGALAVHPQIGQ